jgi:hypothetical protein
MNFCISFHLIVDGEPEEKNLYNQIERCTNLRFLYGKKNYREDNSSNSFLMTEYPSQLIIAGCGSFLGGAARYIISITMKGVSKGFPWGMH